MTEIRNDFHGSRAWVRLGTLSRRTVRRVRNELCGIGSCCCGGNLGERGRQLVEIVPNSDGTVLVRRRQVE